MAEPISKVRGGDSGFGIPGHFGYLTFVPSGSKSILLGSQKIPQFLSSVPIWDNTFKLIIVHMYREEQNT
jgi:hypothetical protein